MASHDPDTENNSKNFASERRSFFGRRKGRSLTPKKQAILEEILPQIEIKQALLSENADLCPKSLFQQNFPEYWLEIGFGQGEHLVGMMEQAPNVGYLGAEPFVNGMAKFIDDIEGLPRHNIRVIMDDALQLARSLTPNSLDGIYVLNPDPWHKTRHHKRRIINHNNLDIFARILKPSGKLIMSTDVPDLTDWMVTKAATHPAFEWAANSALDWRTPPENWIHTRYETKRAKNAHKMSYLFFEKQA